MKNSVYSFQSASITIRVAEFSLPGGTPPCNKRRISQRSTRLPSRFHWFWLPPVLWEVPRRWKLKVSIRVGAGKLLKTDSKPTRTPLTARDMLKPLNKNASRWFWERFISQMDLKLKIASTVSSFNRRSAYDKPMLSRCSADDQLILSWNSMLSQELNLTSNATQAIYLTFVPGEMVPPHASYGLTSFIPLYSVSLL